MLGVDPGPPACWTSPLTIDVSLELHTCSFFSLEHITFLSTQDQDSEQDFAFPLLTLNSPAYDQFLTIYSLPPSKPFWHHMLKVFAVEVWFGYFHSPTKVTLSCCLLGYHLSLELCCFYFREWLCVIPPTLLLLKIYFPLMRWNPMPNTASKH